MSWSSNNDDNSPWGKSSSNNKRKPYNGSGGGNNDDFFDNFQEKLKGFFPKKNKPASLSAIILILLAIWGASGFYRVGTDEQGVVTRFCPEWYQRYRTKIINANDNEMALAA